MTNEFIQWLLGCAFGMIVGWLFTITYHWHKIRQMRLKYLVTQLDEVKGLLNKAIEKNKQIGLPTALEEKVWKTYQNAQGIGKQYSRVAKACGLYLQNGQPNKMRVYRIIQKMKKGET